MLLGLQMKDDVWYQYNLQSNELSLPDNSSGYNYPCFKEQKLKRIILIDSLQRKRTASLKL